MRAGDLGISGYDPDEITENAVLMRRIEKIRLEAGRRIGLDDVTESVVPKVGILSRPRRGGVVHSVYLTPHHVHAAHAVTGAICVAHCVVVRGTVASGVAAWLRAKRESETASSGVATIRIEHPSGTIDILLELDRIGEGPIILHASIVLTTRPIMDGQVLVPEST